MASTSPIRAGKVELLEGSTLEVKDSGTKFNDGTAAANMQKGSTLVVEQDLDAVCEPAQ